MTRPSRVYIFLKNVAFAFDLNAWELVKGGGRGDLGGIIGFGLYHQKKYTQNNA